MELLDQPTAQNQHSLTPDEMSYEAQTTWAMIAHLGIAAGHAVPFGNFILPLVVWLTHRDRSEFIDRHSREAFNHQLSLVIFYIVAIVLCFVLIGIPLLVVLHFYNIIICIIAAIKAKQGEEFK